MVNLHVQPTLEGMILSLVEGKIKLKKDHGEINTSVIVRARSSVSGYDHRNPWWRDAIRHYDTFMGEIRSYWLEVTTTTIKTTIKSF